MLSSCSGPPSLKNTPVPSYYMKMSILLDIAVMCLFSESLGFYLMLIPKFQLVSDVELQKGIVLKLYLRQFRTVAFIWKN